MSTPPETGSKPTSLLTTASRRWLAACAVACAFLLPNAAYLHLRAPSGSVLPTFFQAQLVAHVVVGILFFVPLAVFVTLHVRSLARLGNRRAAASGIMLLAVAVLLAVTGAFILTKANSVENRWAFVGHQALALLSPCVYVLHRASGRHPLTWRGIAVGTCGLGLVLCAMIAIHDATRPPEPPDRPSFLAATTAQSDPYETSFPDEGVSGAPKSSVFFRAATRSQTGNHLSNRILTNGDVPDAAALKADIDKHGFAVDARIGSESCARCHQDTVEQWAASAHRYASFNNPFYRVAVESLREEENGKVRSQWCSGCHDPAIMMPGNMTKEINPHSAEAQAGLTCLACHAMDEVHGVGGNGSYRIADASPDPYLFPNAKGGLFAEVHDALIRSKPDVHRREMKKPVFSTSEYCGTCHKVSLDVPVNEWRWLRGQNEYDAHHDSGVAGNNARTFYLPAETKGCRDCHMPLVDAPLGDLAAKNGKIRSHRFLGPNTALPHIRGDRAALEEAERFLKGSMRIDVAAFRAGDGTVTYAPEVTGASLTAGTEVEFRVVVRNVGVGHTFPGGTTDSNEAWVHFTVTDPATGRVVAESGGLDSESSAIDPDAHRYRTLFVDEEGREISKREPHKFRAIAHQKLIGPGSADVVRYALKIPDDAPRSLKVSAVLRWRKFSPEYTAYTWARTMPGRPVPTLPITDVARTEIELPITPGSAGPFPPPPASTDWTRWNDLGIALLLQGDTRGASAAFGLVSDLRKDLPDGPRNLARSVLEDGDPQTAIEHLQEAERRAPQDPRTAYWFGVARERTGQLTDAVTALEAARLRFPKDRTIHQRLGQIRYRLGEFESALKDFLEVLAIDPEDRTAHYNRMLCFRALGRNDAAEAAEKAYLKYQIDESAQKWTNTFRRERPDVNLESQPLHVHVLGWKP